MNWKIYSNMIIFDNDLTGLEQCKKDSVFYNEKRHSNGLLQNTKWNVLNYQILIKIIEIKLEILFFRYNIIGVQLI